MNGAPLLAVALLASTFFAFAATAQEYVFTHFAGSTGGAGYYDGQGADARFGFPYRGARDRDGNLFVTDRSNHTIRKISPTGFVTTFAGKPGVAGHVDGAGSAARFSFPKGIAIDSTGTIIVADSGSNTVRRITAEGVVTTWVGDSSQAGLADGPGRSARFYDPDGIALDAAGNVYVGDRLNNAIRKITPDGIVTTMAGSGRWSYGWADGNGSSARFSEPSGIAVDSEGNVWVADWGNCVIRKVTPAGEVTTPLGLARTYGSVDGTGDKAKFKFPVDVSFDASGALYVVDADAANVRKVSRELAVTTLAGSGEGGYEDGPAAQARFFNSWGILADRDGGVLVFDSQNYTIRRVFDAAVTTVAGKASYGRVADGAGSRGSFAGPRDVAIDPVGNLFVSDSTSIRKITPGGVVSTLAGDHTFTGWVDGTGAAARFASVGGIGIDSASNVFVTDGNAIRKVTPEGVVTTVAGDASVWGYRDGPASTARFTYPKDVAVDRAGNLFVAEESRIRKISVTGTVTTFAGGQSIGSQDGVGSDATFRSISRLAFDQAGTLWVTDTDNRTIRSITQDARVTTIAGLARSGGTVDGTGPEARFAWPWGIAVMPDGSLVVAQWFGAIRRVSPAGVVTTLGGAPDATANVDGNGSYARFNNPTGVAVDANGTIYIADSENRAIRTGRFALPDRATIDQPTGAAGQGHSLGVFTPTATAFVWRQTIIPSATGASVLENPGERSPTFRPLHAGLHEFLLTARSAEGTSITTVSFDALPAEELVAPRVVATADPDGHVAVSWTRVEGAAWYDVLRRGAGGTLQVVATTAQNTFHDLGTLPDRAYLYQVRASDGRAYSQLSAPDVATTFRFTDDPLFTGTPVRAVHFLEVRRAIEALREIAGIGLYENFSLIARGLPIYQGHLAQLRSAVDWARFALGLPAMQYTNPVFAQWNYRFLIRRDHIAELRDAVR